jgi:glycerol-3-phosphate dehydrogenase
MIDLDSNWDIIVVGGGITGAGIYREAVRAGLKTLLLEQRDFSWGTSSRSSKLVHGGLRYLKEGRFFLTRDAVRERERLLAEAQGLVTPMGFLVPVYKNRGPGRWTLEAGLSIYDLIAKRRQHNYLGVDEFVTLAPHIDRKELTGGFQFFDAQVDDARLVLRLIFEATADGGTAMNYTRVVALRRDESGQVNGATAEDTHTHQTVSLSAKAVVNATGCWAERLHPSPQKNRHLRPLRGSHLIFPAHVLPVEQAISYVHPDDGRAVFLVPWEGAVIAGTTDLDHGDSLSFEPRITEEEVAYLLEGLQALFPALDVSARDCIATIAGVRPVLSEGKRDPSEESREHVVWVDKGLVTITGGKLTTFRQLAHDALKAAKPFLGDEVTFDEDAPVFAAVQPRPASSFPVSDDQWASLYGRYGDAAAKIVAEASPATLETVPNTRTLWAEIVHAASRERIVHLSDLLLRRVRVGLLTDQGGRTHLDRIRHLCAPQLNWDAARWRKEIRNYLETWQFAHGMPGRHAASRGRVKSFFHRLGSRLRERLI